MDKPPLDAPRWWPMQKAIDAHAAQTGDRELAVRDLEQAMESGKLRGMRRSRNSGKRELLSGPFGKLFIWFQCCTDIDDASERRMSVDYPFDDWMFYVWKPDFDRLYSVARSDHDDGGESPPPVKPGKKPRGNWPMLVAQWLIEVAADDRQRLQNVDALVTEAKIFLRNQIQWAPKDDKDLRAKIRELLGRVRR
jgi:hypothetical protein